MEKCLDVAIVTGNETLDKISGNILGIIEYGVNAIFAADADAKSLPYQFIQVKSINENFCEVWFTEETVYYRKSESCRIGESENLCFRTVTVYDEAGGHQEKAENAYKQIFSELNLDLYHVVRFWNYIPNINEKGDVQERYKEFCAGREDAFLELYHKNDSVYPAATGVGTYGNDLCLCLLAVHKKAKRCNIENPNQVPAYCYPRQFGASSPKFSRAAYVEFQSEKIMLISGTASIIGTESVYMGDVVMQTNTTIDNIKILFDEKNLRKYAIDYWRIKAKLKYLKVYIRNWDDFPIIRQICENRFEKEKIVYLQSDICRSELLVEIEGVWIG
ncbi:pteridine-dependent deoxygenase like protein [Lacrimispora amygdalina]|uniref:Pteridine-dependent deoxygenase like protein n=1 Tax=Lacrimispora amygdalina TaxID=253257 RepID=A0ABQ5M9J5_9FIRM|nr:hypothetical protein [uncultured Clostridium sp.]